MCLISVDGDVKYTTKPTKTRWDEPADIQVDNGSEIEIYICDKSGQILALTWFRIKDFIEYKRVSKVSSNQELILSTEPSGTLSFQLKFIQSNTVTEKDKLFRRDAVQKVYPKNGHRYVAKQFYQVMNCTICSEFILRKGYQCTCIL